MSHPFSLPGAYRRLLHELTAFGTVGLVAFVVDVGTFNVLRSPFSVGLLHAKPVTAKIASTVVATLVAYLGNRHWTYRERRAPWHWREPAQFALVNGIAVLPALGVLAVSHYLLGWTSQAADNVSANVIGLALGTLLRFWLYRRWVFTPGPARPAEAATGTARTPPGGD